MGVDYLDFGLLLVPVFADVREVQAEVAVCMGRKGNGGDGHCVGLEVGVVIVIEDDVDVDFGDGCRSVVGDVTFEGDSSYAGGGCGLAGLDSGDDEVGGVVFRGGRVEGGVAMSTAIAIWTMR